MQVLTIKLSHVFIIAELLYFCAFNNQIMATYNKRGYKPKTKKEKIDNEVEEIFDESESTTAEVFSTLDEGASKTEEWVSKNQNIIFAIVGVAALVALGYWAYNNFVMAPKADEAILESKEADKYFDLAMNSTSTQEKDSLFMLSIEGVNGKYGYAKIAEEYAGTDAANIANYKAGMAYLNIGGDKYQKAIDYLSEYDGNGSVLASLAKAGIADALVQANQAEQAIPYYLEAAEIESNDFTSPKYLLKAAQAALQAGDNSTAVDALEKIESEFPESDEKTTAQVLLAQARASKN